ncbi:hypothetical protein DFH07DRAFT_694294, partial [Mycena maculata]
TYSVVINGIPSTFDVSSEEGILRLEDDNPDILLPFSVARVRWLRKPRSNFGSIVVEIRDTKSANQSIDTGLSFDFSLYTVHKLTAKITQCFNCQGYGHITKSCKKAASCGLCAGGHATKVCPATN